jgi:haloalkane dehalogenase
MLTQAPTQADTADWSFAGTWPYEPRWLLTDGLRIHYVDEGPRDGEAVVMLHGHPAWSYLYRHFIRGLSEAGFRAIAHDQAGFGRSDKPRRVDDYSIERNLRHFNALLDELELDTLTLVLHDWGGPLGLAWAVDHPERVRRVVVLNTFSGSMPPDADRRAVAWIKLMRSRGLGDLLVRGARLPVRVFLLRMGIAHRDRIGPHERAAYLAPHPRNGTRAGLLAYPRLMPIEEDHPTRALAGRIEAGLPKLAGTPALICRGLRDPGLQAGILTLGETSFPRAEVHEFEDASHFLQEDAHERIVPLMIDFIRRT